MRVEITINAPASEAWRVMGERFGDIGHWASPITASRLDGDAAVGAVRDCHIAGFGPIGAGIIKEQLTRFQPDEMTFQYDAIQGMPNFIRSATAQWTVEAIGPGACVAQTKATVSLRGLARLASPILKPRMMKDGLRVLEELKHYLEHGQPHPRKAAAQARHAPAPI